MTTIQLNADELAALAGLPHLAVCLYVMAIRTRMDYTTGIVGDRPRVSWQAFTEWLYVEPHAGHRSGSPSKSAARRAARRLEKAGLIVFKSSIANAQLRIFLPFAKRSAPSIVRSQVDTKPTGASDRVLQREKPPQADRGGKAQADIHPVSGSTNTRHHNNVPIYTGNGSTLLWCDSIGETDRQAIEKQLRQHVILNGEAQAIIDELAGAIAVKPVGNKAGYARTLIERTIAGTFTPERANAIAEARQRRAAVAASIEQAASAPPAEPRDIEKGRAALDKIRKRMKGSA